MSGLLESISRWKMPNVEATLGNGAPNIVDFDKEYKTAKDRCNFGKQYGIEWDGLTNASPRLC